MLTHSSAEWPEPSGAMRLLPELLRGHLSAPASATSRIAPPAGVDMPYIDPEELRKLPLPLIRVKARKVLFREGDRLNSVYAVYSGTFKSCLSTSDGREQVSGFQMSGDLLGLDGLSLGWHASSAVALEDAQVCPIPYASLSNAEATRSGLTQALVRLMSLEIVREHKLLVLLGTMDAEEKLAVFLLKLSDGMKARGYSGLEFNLRMSRAEIGSYLGLTLETVSRTFSCFQQQRLLEVDKRYIRILDMPQLARRVKSL